EMHARGIIRGSGAGDHVLFEADFAIGAHLLIPNDAVAMGIEAGDDVVESIAIDIIGEHLRGPRGSRARREWERMEFPNRIAAKRGGLLPPAIFFQEIHAAVAIDIAQADAMGESTPVAFGRDSVEDPSRGGICPIDRIISEVTMGVADQFWFAVAVDVQPSGRFVIN